MTREACGILQILQKLASRMPLSPDVDLGNLAASTADFTGEHTLGQPNRLHFAGNQLKCTHLH